MMKENRLSQMEEYITERDYVALTELCDVFGKSMNTIRRDIAELSSSGLIQKVYGGVKPSAGDHKHPVPFTDRHVKNVEEKFAISAAAAQFIQDGDVIFVDSGTTTVGIVDNVAHLSGITVLTNNVHILQSCLDKPNINLIVLGGQLNTSTASLSASFGTLDFLQMFNISKAFMAATGVSVDKGATHTSQQELATKQTIVQRSDSNYLLADHSKFGHSALLTYASLSAFQKVITDCAPPPAFSAYFQEHGVELVTCK